MCVVKNCRHRFRESHPSLQLCHKHYQARWRFLNPKQAGYRALRDHAVARGLEFSIPFEYYLAVMDMAASFDPGAEKRGDRVTVDRKDPTIGYRMGNLQLLTLSENVAKGNRERHLPDAVKSILARKRARFSGKQDDWDPDSGEDPF